MYRPQIRTFRRNDTDNHKTLFPATSCIFIIIIGIQPLGRFGQRPELSQATGIALVHCILGKFLGVGCHYFPPPVSIYCT